MNYLGLLRLMRGPSVRRTVEVEHPRLGTCIVSVGSWYEHEKSPALTDPYVVLLTHTKPVNGYFMEYWWDLQFHRATKKGVSAKFRTRRVPSNITGPLLELRREVEKLTLEQHPELHAELVKESQQKYQAQLIAARNQLQTLLDREGITS